MKMIIIVVVVGVLLLAGCIGQESAQDTTQNATIQQNSAAQQNITVQNSTMQNNSGESMANKSENVVIETNKGNLEIELNRAKAPETVGNFLKYVESGFYNNTVFHRVIKGFMVQGGGFTRGGTEKETLDPIKLESNNGLSNFRGTIAMARTNAPDSATSQFFINTKDNAFLNYQSAGNPGYAVFGKVVSGMDVVDAIESSKTATKGYYEDWPVEDILITGAYLKE